MTVPCHVFHTSYRVPVVYIPVTVYNGTGRIERTSTMRVEIESTTVSAEYDVDDECRRY
jgi:hypothetical protein